MGLGVEVYRVKVWVRFGVRVPARVGIGICLG